MALEVNAFVALISIVLAVGATFAWGLFLHPKK
jgi:hypothetical protein